MKCKYCQAELDNDSLFCTNCGKDLSKFSRCVKCGEILDDHSVFCPYCGAQQPQEGPVQLEEVPKKSKKWIWVLCTIGILLLLIGGGAFYHFNMKETADESSVAQDSVSVADITEKNVKENKFKEIVKNGVWVKANDEYKELNIHIEWPEDLLTGDVIPLQERLSMAAFNFKRRAIDDAVSKYISNVGTPIEKPTLSEDDRDYNGCDIYDSYLEIKKVAYEQGSFITYYVFKQESLKWTSSITVGNYNYYTYDLKENKFLQKHEIIIDSTKESELQEKIKNKFTEDDKTVMTFNDPSGMEKLDFSNVHVGDREIVFTFRGHHNHEVKISMYYKEIYDFLTDRIKEYFKNYN